MPAYFFQRAVKMTGEEFDFEFKSMRGMISRRVGSYLDVATNIHSEEDLLQAERNILGTSLPAGFDEDESNRRMDIIGQNGPTGAHYEQEGMYPWHNHEEEG